MPKTKGKRGGEAQGIETRKRGEGLFNKKEIDKVTNIKERYLNTNHKIRLINKTQDFVTSLKDYSSSIGRFLLENNLNKIREIYINLIYSKYKQRTRGFIRSIK